MKRIIINATSVKAGGAKKRLAEFVRRADEDPEYEIALIINKHIDIVTYNAVVIRVPSTLEPLFKLLSDMLLVPMLYFIGYKKIYVFGNFFISPYPGKIAWNLTNIEPFVHQEFGVQYVGRQKWRLALLRLLFSLSRSPKILIAQSASTANLLRNILSCRVEHVYNGVDIASPQLVRKVAERAADKVFRLTVVSQVIRYKRIDRLVKYLAEAGLFDVVRLDVVGKLTWDEDYVQELRDLITDYNINDKVLLHGELSNSNVISLLAGSDALIYTNAYDNCPNAVLEAMSQGVHVIALNNSVVRELADKYGGVSFFNFDMDRDDFITLLNNPKKSAYDFTWDNHYSYVMRLIDSM